MTQEEKAKAYDEALERARKYMAKGYDVLMPEIFPELAENRDERILEIIKHCIESRYLHTSTIKGISQEECFAWLEKQGESYTKRDVDDAFAEGMAFAKDELEKQSEQKYAPIDIDKMVDKYANTKERGNEEFGLPLNCMIRAYRQGINDVIGKVALKPTWSEEDEKNLQGIINAIKELRCQSLLSEIEIYDDYIDWLKSLKQKYAWKPSDEQMDALETLYDNLKRL